MLSDAMRARLIKYVEGFKTGDFDTVLAMLADDVKLDLVAKLHKRGKSEVGDTTLPMQLPNGGLTRPALSMAWPRCSYTIAGSHSRLLLILLPWISMAIAWSRSMTSCLPVMRWTASTCHRSIPHRRKTLLKEIVSGQRDPRCAPGIGSEQKRYSAANYKNELHGLSLRLMRSKVSSS